MQCERHIGKREGEREGGYVGGGREQLWGARGRGSITS